MEATITNVSLVVRNKTQALEFFTSKVGFEKKTDVTGPGGYRYVTVGPKGQPLELALWEVGSGTDPALKTESEAWKPASAPPMVISVPDCKQAHAELKGRGVEFTQPPEDHPWGVIATFRDPDGNLFSISQFRAWQPKP
jgi:catechol 2,3-dioxygenase-like lactoylglutathione lyase family enzyme